MWHIMKNRYGADGLTFSSKINTSNGYIEINDQPITITDEDSGNKGKKSNNDFDAVDKEILKKKFFELQP
jgi:hypothetical protein